MDALQERSPFDAASKQILLYGQNGGITCYLTPNAITDIFYLYSKARNISAANAALTFLLKTYKIISITHEDCISALSLPTADFEDALVVISALNANADFIITRDKNFLAADTPINTISPNEFVTAYMQ